MTVPRSLLELLLRLLILRTPFDEADYLARNPDVGAAVKAGSMRSGHEHFVTVGYFEGRRGGSPMVDENYYVSAYADVARAVAQGDMTSAGDHYITSGAQEWRVPSADAAPVVAAWRQALTLPDVLTETVPKPRRLRR